MFAGQLHSNTVVGKGRTKMCFGSVIGEATWMKYHFITCAHMPASLITKLYLHGTITEVV